VKIGVLADTHIKDSAQVLPGLIFHAFRDVELILHAGDILVPSVLDELASLAPVRAVCGNVDGPELQRELPLSLVLEFEGHKIGLTHGHGGEPGKTTERVLELMAGEECDCIVFGHSHQPYQGWHDGTLLFNPGSPTRPRREDYPTFGTLHLGDNIVGRIFQFEPESNMVIGEYH